MTPPTFRASLRRTGHRMLSWLTPFKPFIEFVCEGEARIAAAWAASAHHRLLMAQWSIPPQPEHFDHTIDLYWHWRATRNPLWVERGAFGTLALVNGGDILELCCGDGFNTRNFYSLRARRVIACDFDPLAIRTARRSHAAPNVTYVLADIRNAMPAGSFDNIIWDAAIEHFTPDEIDTILRALRDRLAPNGIVSGYTIVERARNVKMLSHHEYEFRDKNDLLRFLTPHFQRVVVFESVYPDRHNLYFFASDGPIPFDRDWPGAQWHLPAGSP